VKLYLLPAIGMVAMSLGFMHLHLSLTRPQVRASARCEADAALHLLLAVFQLQAVHLAQSVLVFALLLHRFSTYASVPP
jgi:hypothetical protein